MAATKLPFHADHIGSFIRPASLFETQKRADKGEVTASDLQAAQLAAIADIVSKQRAHGVCSLTSGEFDRKYYFSGFFEKITGCREVSPVPWELTRLSAPPIAALKRNGQQYPMAALCEAKMSYDSSPYLENWRMLRDTLPKEQWAECKFTMPPPCYFHLRLAPGKCYSPQAYASDQDFFADLAEVYRREIRTLFDEGLRNLQIDDPTLAYFCSDEMRESLRADGVDPDELFELYLKAHNDCIADRPDGLHVGLHICRVDALQRRLVRENRRALLRHPQLRHLLPRIRQPSLGGFEPLRFLPKHKNVVLGVVTTKDPELEDPEVIKRRVREAAQIIAEGQGRSAEDVMENIGISPQCGFASVSVGADGMTEEKMFAKLRLVKDVARELWPDRL
ncbi:hypothetical protein PT974_03704 [Cladobotryum mycophilum]|uniref:Cobalamin-independent methionine synthase MetE C-terminal/archaeal domain-containing protein n=1 Tax=Cladobotryum mycophilum TaxID=491253 RepID=A0ABR0ST22_9HYPO